MGIEPVSYNKPVLDSKKWIMTNKKKTSGQKTEVKERVEKKKDGNKQERVESRKRDRERFWSSL